MSPAGGDQSTGPSQRGRRDSATGLQLLPAPALVTHRITRSSRGPLDPPLRGGAPDASWSRYDVVGRTVYLAETAECAYAEVLAYTKRRLGQQDPLTKGAAAVGLSVAEFSGLVGAEWVERQHMGVGYLPSSWRVERLLYRITLPEAGWWVDIQHPDSLAAAETELEVELATLDLSALTVAVLLGDDRHVTTAVARWVHDYAWTTAAPRWVWLTTASTAPDAAGPVGYRAARSVSTVSSATTGRRSSRLMMTSSGSRSDSVSTFGRPIMIERLALNSALAGLSWHWTSCLGRSARRDPGLV